MPMAEETSSSTKPPAAPSTDAPPETRRDYSELRKEVVEARNLIIKTDNLLKNMHAELKRVGERQEEFARRRLFSSATAYVIFALLAAVGAFSVARTDSAREREQSTASDAKAHELQQKLDAALRGEQVRREASEKAARVFDQLASEKEGPGLSQAMANALRMDHAQLSPLEAKALEDRVATLKAQVAQGALERGNAAYRHLDHKAVSIEYGRYLDLVGTTNDPQLYFHLGYSRAQLKEFAGAIDPLEKFLKVQSQGKLAQSAGYWLGFAYEETGAPAKATDAYQKALALFPGSEVAPVIRGRLRRLSQSAAAPQAAPAPAAPAPAAPRAGSTQAQAQPAH
jgi:TolA-binding protein